MPSRICRWVGAILIGLGIWGFTAQGSFLVFQVNPVHHIAQVVVGAAALWAGWSDERTARRFAVGLASGFALSGLLGLMNVSVLVDYLNLGTADHWLHLLIGGASLAGALRSRVTLMGARPAQMSARGVSGAL